MLPARQDREGGRARREGGWVAEVDAKGGFRQEGEGEKGEGASAREGQRERGGAEVGFGVMVRQLV